MAAELDFAERRVLGVLIEKGYTTPQQYPLTLNALVSGANQKSCRDPVASLGEEAVLDAIASLRRKGLATLHRAGGGRTDRYRHDVIEKLEIDAPEAAALAELLLRGPQTDGELRQRAKRMVPISDLATLSRTIARLMERDPPLVRRLSPAGRRRGVQYAHTLYREGEAPSAEDPTGPPPWEPSLESAPETETGPSSRAETPGDAAEASALPVAPAPPLVAAFAADELAALRERVETIETRLARVEEELHRREE